MSKPRIRQATVREGSDAGKWNADDWKRWGVRVFMVALIAAGTAAVDALELELQSIEAGPVWTGAIVLLVGTTFQTLRTWLIKQAPTEVK